MKGIQVGKVVPQKSRELIYLVTSDFPRWRKWTLTHGHLLGMGGFTLVDPDQKHAEPNGQNGTVLTFDYFKQNPNIDVAEITTAEIEDRSKGDALWKIIAILQTTWFLIQCIARGQQRLALTGLELITLALASLNAVTFAIWWHKPLGLQEPVKIYLKTEARRAEDDVVYVDRNFGLSFRNVIRRGWRAADRSIAGVLIIVLQNPGEVGLIAASILLSIAIPLTFTFIISFPVFVLFPLGIILLLRIIKTEPVRQDSFPSHGLLAARIVASLQIFRYRLTSTVSHFFGTKLKDIFSERYAMSDLFSHVVFGWYILLPSLFVLLLLFVLFLIPFFTLLFLISFIFTAVFSIVTTSTVCPGASHVPSFYAPTTSNDRWLRIAAFALFGVIFGGLHCIGWYFKYPTQIEETLWRATSLAITVIPLVVAPIDFLLATRDINSCAMAGRTALLILDLIMTILLFIYVIARLSLIGQALALLRNQPPSALVAVDWTQYIPHLF